MKSIRQPLLSLVVTVLDTAFGLEEMLRGMPKALASRVEMVLVDDGSGARHAAEIDRVAKLGGSRVTLIRNRRNVGVVRSQNKAAKVARGKFICFRGGDDRNRDEFWRVVGEILPHTDARLVCGDVMKVRAGSAPVRESCGWAVPGSSVRLSPEQFSEVSQEKIIWGHTALIHRTTFLAFGGMRVSLEWIADLILTASIGFVHGVHYVASPLVEVDVDRGSYSSTGFGSSNRKAAVYSALLRYVRRLPERRLAAFAVSGWLGCFGSDLARVYLNQPALWSTRLSTVLVRNLHYNTQEMSGEMARGEGVRDLLRALDRLSRDLVGHSRAKIAVYGAGEIGRGVARVWSLTALPDIACFVTSDAVPEGAAFLGYPLVNSQTLASRSFDRIVIASRVFREELVEVCVRFGYARSAIVTLFDGAG